MKILAVDDEHIQLKMLEKSIRTAIPDCELFCFSNSVEALKWAQQEQPDVAFCDIQMPVMTGIELGKELKKCNPHINLIFVTAYYADYAVDAMPLHFSGYLQKPATAEAVTKEMENLRYPLPTPEQNVPEKVNEQELNGQKLKVQCFGNFEVFYKNKPVHFEKKKTRELFAYLVDRKGAQATSSEICSVLYEDDQNESNNKADLRKCTADLKKSLKEIGLEAVFLKSFNAFAIDTSLISCDYYDWEKGEAYAVRAFHGEYMNQYSWGEYTLGQILSD